MLDAIVLAMRSMCAYLHLRVANLHRTHNKTVKLAASCGRVSRQPLPLDLLILAQCLTGVSPCSPEGPCQKGSPKLKNLVSVLRVKLALVFCKQLAV